MIEFRQFLVLCASIPPGAKPIIAHGELLEFPALPWAEVWFARQAGNENGKPGAAPPSGRPLL